MGCLFSLIELFFKLIYYIFVIIGYVVVFIFCLIRELIRYIVNRTNKNNTSKFYQNFVPKTNLSSETYSKKKNTNGCSYLKLYIKKSYKNLKSGDNLNYDILNIEWYDAPTLYYDDYAEVPGYNVFEGDEYSSEQYGNVLLKVYNYCRDNFYATIEYEKGRVEYKFTVKDGIVYLNGENINNLINRYNALKNKIITFADKIYDYFLYIEDDKFSDQVVPNDDLECYSISKLSDKLKDTNDILIFELPFMEEIAYIIDIIEPKIIREYKIGLKKENISIPNVEFIDFDQEPEMRNNKNSKKKKVFSFKDEQFEKEADLWGLSKEDRRIAKEERMSPSDFIEAEEYDDDELLKDEWER